MERQAEGYEEAEAVRQWGSWAKRNRAASLCHTNIQWQKSSLSPSCLPVAISSCPGRHILLASFGFFGFSAKKKIKHNNNNNNEIKWKKSKRKAPHRQFRVQGYCASFYPLLPPLEGGGGVSASCSFANFIDSLLGRCQECIRWVGDCCFSWAWAALEGTSIIVPSSLSLSLSAISLSSSTCFFSLRSSLLLQLHNVVDFLGSQYNYCI